MEITGKISLVHTTSNSYAECLNQSGEWEVTFQEKLYGRNFKKYMVKGPHLQDEWWYIEWIVARDGTVLRFDPKLLTKNVTILIQSLGGSQEFKGTALALIHVKYVERDVNELNGKYHR